MHPLADFCYILKDHLRSSHHCGLTMSTYYSRNDSRLDNFLSHHRLIPKLGLAYGYLSKVFNDTSLSRAVMISAYLAKPAKGNSSFLCKRDMISR